MTEKLTPEQRIEQAIDMVHALCQPRGSGRDREWIMSIPARPDYDPDLVIASGLRAGEDALAELARLRELVEKQRVALQEIAKREGPFKRDQQEFAMSVIDNMGGLADAALQDQPEEQQDE